VLLALLIAPCLAGDGEGDWKPLWDGKTLEGWHKQGGGSWAIEDGVLVGTHQKGDPAHGHLVTDRVYGDFTVRLKYKSLKGNSGFYFRVEEAGGRVGVKGFQAEIDPRNNPGGLYETGGRAWVARPDKETVQKCFKPDEWNQMTVSARGRDVTVTVNGVKTAELKDDPGRLKGHIALQLHGGQDVLVQFKDIEQLVEPEKE
jgi:hypothetical protein